MSAIPRPSIRGASQATGFEVDGLAASLEAWREYLPEPVLPPEGAAFRTFLVKLHRDCNLSCSYCYIYTMGDMRWQSNPRVMARSVVEASARRIREHVETHDIPAIDVTFHGGEPLLAGAERIRDYKRTIECEVADLTRVHFGMQTNGTLLSTKALDMLAAERIGFGVSLDGPEAVNDSRRRDHAGRGSSTAVLRALEAIDRHPARDLFTGFLAVVDVTTRPLEILKFFDKLGARRLDLLLPHGNWDRLPPGKSSPHDTSYGRWLVEAFDLWFERFSHIRIRTFADLLKLRLGGTGSVESIGLAAGSLVVVETGGAIEPVDTLRSVGNAATDLGLSVFHNSFDDALGHPAFASRFAGEKALSESCRHCRHLRTCGGGYLPHRFGRGRGYINASVYCADLLMLCDRVDAVMRVTLRSESLDDGNCR